MQGAAQRELREARFFAQMTANIMNASGNMRTPVTADDLLGLPKKRQRQRTSSYKDLSPEARKDILAQIPRVRRPKR